MNPIQELIANFQNLVAQVPEIIQPFIVMLAGAIPFLEGEVGAIVGVVGGLNPIVAGVSAAIGNFLSVFFVIMLSSRARSAVVNRRSRTPQTTAIPTGAQTESSVAVLEADSGKPQSKGRQRFNKWLVRFGVPGASILGPLAIPTQITSGILVAAGTPRQWVLLWQTVAIVIWTTISTVSVWLALQLVTSL